MSIEDTLRKAEIMLEESDRQVMRMLMRPFEPEVQTATNISRQPTEYQLREIQRQMIDNPVRKIMINNIVKIRALMPSEPISVKKNNLNVALIT